MNEIDKIFNIDKLVSNMYIMENVLIYNKHHEKDYYNKKGVLVIEYFDKSRNILNLENGSDISNCDYLEIKIIHGKTNFKKIFKNVLSR